MSEQNVQVAGFQREIRYLVIKRKHLHPEEEVKLLWMLNEWGVQPTRGVVVERDWPEYEPVWQMIERRCTETNAAPSCKNCDGTGEVGGDYGLTPHHCDCRTSNSKEAPDE